MIRGEVNKDIRNTKDSFLGPLSFRQTISIVIGLAITYFVTTTFFPEVSLFSETFTYICIPCIGIPVLIGCVPIHGLHAEDFLISYMPYFLYPKVRTYDTGLQKEKKPRKTIKSRKKKNQAYR